MLPINERCIYIAGKYSGANYQEIDRNIVAARDAAAEFFKKGVKAFCPHQHSAHFECITPDVPYEFWLDLDLHFMFTSCQAVYFLPGWEQSSGARNEHDEAIARGMPCFYTIETALRWAQVGA